MNDLDVLRTLQQVGSFGVLHSIRMKREEHLRGRNQPSNRANHMSNLSSWHVPLIVYYSGAVETESTKNAHSPDAAGSCTVPQCRSKGHQPKNGSDNLAQDHYLSWEKSPGLTKEDPQKGGFSGGKRVSFPHPPPKKKKSFSVFFPFQPYKHCCPAFPNAHHTGEASHVPGDLAR